VFVLLKMLAQLCLEKIIELLAGILFLLVESIAISVGAIVDWQRWVHEALSLV
jgi:hypothetical protein